MLQKVALTDISAWDVAWPVAAGAGIGLGARLLRQGHDLKTKRGIRPPKEAPPIESAQIEVPVEITPEEAKELRRQGLKVGSFLDRCNGGPAEGVPDGVKIATAGAPIAPIQAGKPATVGTGRSLAPGAKVVADTTTMPSAAGVTTKIGAEGLTATVAQGLLGAGAAYGGWTLLDKHLDDQRVEKAKASLNRSRERVKRLIAGDPDPSEAGMAQALKIAEEVFLKQAGFVSDAGGAAVGGVADLMAPIGIPLGIGAALIGAKAYNDTKSTNKYRQRVKQITESMEHEDPVPPIAVLHPVVKRPVKIDPVTGLPKRRGRPAKNSPSDAGVLHNPGAEPTASLELDRAEIKLAAEDDDEDYGSWVALAVAGLAGAAGLMWVRENPGVAKQYAPKFLHGAIDTVAQFGKPTPEQTAAAKAHVNQTGATAGTESTAPAEPTPAAAPAPAAPPAGPAPVATAAAPAEPQPTTAPAAPGVTSPAPVPPTPAPVPAKPSVPPLIARPPERVAPTPAPTPAAPLTPPTPAAGP